MNPSSEKPAIVISDVSKVFKLKHTNSFKEAFVAMVKRKELSSQFRAVDSLNLVVPAGQSIALLGRNGSGKSTTLKLLSGVMKPDSGWLRTRGRVAGLLEVGAGFHPDLTGRQNVYLNAAILGMSKDETDAQFDSILEFSEIGDFIDTEVKHYSSGMYARLGFSVAVHTEVDVLLVDEVLSVGDAAFRAKCNDRMLAMREQGKTMFIVSHNASQVKKLCDRGVVLDGGRVVFDGGIDEALEVLSERTAPPLPFPVAGAIRAFYDQKAKSFGKPLGPEVDFTENGGGKFQNFERGIITHSYSLPRENQAQGLTNGLFLAAYLRAGGPTGAWGAIAGTPRGSVEKFEKRWMRFQHGIASYTLDDGFQFDPNSVDADTQGSSS